MILVAIVDKAGGMLFNGRRQSQDRLLRERLLSLSASSKLWISPFSAAQFTEGAPHLVSDPQWLEKAGEEEYCLVEDRDPSPYLERARGVVLYHWNRAYPGDLFFSALPLPKKVWKCLQKTDFAGSSHPKITEEIYQKKG